MHRFVYDVNVAVLTVVGNIVARNYLVQPAVLTGRPAVRGFRTDVCASTAPPLRYQIIGMAVVHLLSAMTLEHKLVTGRDVTLSHRCPVLVPNRKSLCVCRQAAATLFASDVKFGRLGIHHHAITVAGLERLQQYADRPSDPRLVVPY